MRIFFAAFLVLLILAPREPWTGQARLVTASARELVSRGDLDIATDGALTDNEVSGGRRWARVALGPVLALAPVELPLILVPRNDRGARVARFVEAASAAAGAALTCAVFFALLGRWGVRKNLARLFTLVLFASTTLFVYGRVPDGSVWAALCLLVGVEQARRAVAAPSARAGILLGDAAALLVLFDLGWAALVLIAYALVFAPRRRALAWMAAPLAAAFALVWFHHHLAGISAEATGDLLEGLDGLLISTGKSLFAYSPPLVLGALALPWWWRNRRADAALVIAVAVAVILPAASLERWHGDPAWGPRRLVPLVPLGLALAGPWLEASWPGLRTWLAALFAAGVIVQLLGAAFPPETYLRIAAVVKNGSGATGWFGDPDQAHFIPQFSPIVGHGWLLSHLIKKEKRLELAPPWALILPATPRLESEWPRVRLDWWALSLKGDTVKK